MNRFLILFFFLPIQVLFSQNSLNAFGDTPWGTSFKDVKSKFASLLSNPNSTEDLKILNEVKNKLIVVKRNNVTYFYRFYKEPKEVKEVKALEKANTEGAEKADHKAVTGLYSVGLQFPPVPTERVKDSLKKYGSPTREYLVDNVYGIIVEKKAPAKAEEKKAEPGDPNAEEPEEEEEELETARKVPLALIWNLSGENNGAKDGGFIFQWNEPFSRKLYSKRIDYFSAEISGMINDDFKKYFSANETKIIMDLLADPAGGGGDKKAPEGTPN
ncbi:MAG: hypothetical protein H7A24_05270 [Leptospiraceae bacterium]|nr:hypothetical protein [Leptospiraceae bacterium]MCP5511268.1 hypothetical protein [Leptospiraceae bacterium]